MKAVVHNGRIFLDEPTTLPEGTVIELQAVDQYSFLDSTNEMSSEEREKLNASIDRGLAQISSGQGVSAAESVAQLRRAR